MMAWNFIAVALLLAIGLYITMASGNFIKKIVGLNIFQTAVFIYFISMGKVSEGSAPILKAGITLFSNPLPHVLILTAIVVSVATTTLALSLVVRIQKAFGSIEEDDVASHIQDNR